jgi:hypothetical protein
MQKSVHDHVFFILRQKGKHSSEYQDNEFEYWSEYIP